MLFRKKEMDGYEYETYVAELLRRQGFRDITFTPRTGDFGVDLLATHGRNRYAVQCKYYSGSVGGAAVQEAAAGMAYYDCERGMVVTNSVLTEGARELAKANGIEVMEYIDPKSRSFLERREAWELILLAVECVVFGLALHQVFIQNSFTWRGLGILLLLCFPIPYVLCRLVRWIQRRMHRKKASAAAEAAESEDDSQ
ncbi:MAG: restriction endonuclease [Clostridiales bacterium]|nr:restriction endonuclease [Clostridiales bacterium]